MPWYNSMYDYHPETDDELEHHGIKGQEWGKQNGPPYPLNPAVSSAVKQGKSESEIRAIRRKREASLRKARAAKAKKRAESEREKAEAAKKAEKEAKEKADAEKKAAKEAKKLAKKKEKALKDPNSLIRNKDLFDTDELDAALKRLTIEDKIKDLSSKKISRGKSAVEALGAVGIAGITGWNVAASIYNAYQTSQGNTDRLPQIRFAKPLMEGKEKKD